MSVVVTRRPSRRTLWLAAGAVLGSVALPVAAQLGARVFADGASETALLAVLASAEPDRFRPVGTSSVVFQVDLRGDVDMAFRPESRSQSHGWLAEVAAYRIARELALDDVPPAIVRSIDRGRLRARLEREASFDDVASACVFRGEELRGAAIYWVPSLSRSDLDTRDGIARWRSWLAIGGDVPSDAMATARDISNMVLFDYVIGNRDRWSGGNVRTVGAGRVVIRDHNLAFPMRLDAAGHQRMLEHLTHVQRFSRTTVLRLAALDARALREALEHDELGTVLDDRRMAGVIDRRDAILSYVASLIAEHGEQVVLWFD